METSHIKSSRCAHIRPYVRWFCTAVWLNVMLLLPLRMFRIREMRLALLRENNRFDIHSNIWHKVVRSFSSQFLNITLLIRDIFRKNNSLFSIVKRQTHTYICMHTHARVCANIILIRWRSLPSVACFRFFT